jgi:hypothetical protein
MDVVLFVILLALGIFVYFLPSFIAASKQNAGAIFTLNLLLGWTLIGWVAALIWAMVTPATALVSAQDDPVDMRDCPHCAEPIRAAATKCKHCGSELIVSTPPPMKAQEATDHAARETADNEAQMQRYGITDDGIFFHFGSYRYEKLSDAVAYAELQAT